MNDDHIGINPNNAVIHTLDNDYGYALANTSMSHTYGNVTRFITEYLKGLFPKDFFKHTSISSTMAYRYFNIFQNRNKEFLKNNKPFLIIRPRLEVDDTDRFLYGTLLTQRITDNYNEHDFSNLQPFIEDKSNRVMMKFLLNRIKILFDINIITETQIEQFNTHSYLTNRIRTGHNFFISTALESYVPKQLLEYYSKDSNIPMYDQKGSVKSFLDHINSHSCYPVTYKMKNSSGIDEFFRYYPVNIDTILSVPTIDDGSKRNMVSDAYSITFTINTEFNAAGLYYYFSPSISMKNETVSIDYDNSLMMSSFTIPNLYDVKLPNGWQLHVTSLYQVEDVEPNSEGVKEDITSLESVVSNQIKLAIDYHIKNGMKPEDIFIKTMVMLTNELLVEGRDFKINYETLELSTYRINSESTYRVLIYINSLYINDFINNVYKLDNDR